MTQKAKGGEASSPREKTRLNVILSPSERERVERLKKMTGTDSVTEVTKDAFRLLEFLLIKAEGGSKLLIQDPGEEPAKLEIFGVTTR